MTTLAGLVAAGGIGFVNREVGRETRPGVVFREAPGAPAVPMAAAWLPSDPSPTGRRFLEILDDYMRPYKEAPDRRQFE